MGEARIAKAEMKSECVCTTSLRRNALAARLYRDRRVESVGWDLFKGIIVVFERVVIVAVAIAFGEGEEVKHQLKLAGFCSPEVARAIEGRIKFAVTSELYTDKR